MKKGFVLTMDVAISIAIVGLLLLASRPMVSDAFPELEAKRLATDIVVALDYTGVLDTYNKQSIEGNLSRLLPLNINMSMIIRRYNSTSFVSQIQINANITDNYLGGRWWFTTINSSSQFFHVVDYRVRFR